MILILFYIFSFLFVSNYSKRFGLNKRVKVQMIWSFILLFVFFSLRGLPVLNDTHHYYNGQLEEIMNGCVNRPFYQYNPDSRYGAGYQIFQHIVANIALDPYALIFFSSLIFTIGSLWFIKRNTDEIALTIFILLGLSLMFGQYAALRQSLATILFYLSCFFCARRKHILGLLLIFLAMQFHSSANVLILLYLLFQIPINRRNIIIAFGVCLIVCVALLPILNFFDYGDNHYVTDMYDRSNAAWSAILSAVMFSIAILECYWLKNKYNIEPPDRIIIWGAIMGVFFNFASIIVIVFDRLALYTAVFNVIMFVHFWSKSPRYEQNKLLKIIIAIVLIRMSLEMGLKNEWKHLVPYSFYDFSNPNIYLDFGY